MHEGTGKHAMQACTRVLFHITAWASSAYISSSSGRTSAAKHACMTALFRITAWDISAAYHLMGACLQRCTLAAAPSIYVSG